MEDKSKTVKDKDPKKDDENSSDDELLMNQITSKQFSKAKQKEILDIAKSVNKKDTNLNSHSNMSTNQLQSLDQIGQQLDRQYKSGQLNQTQL